MSNDDFQDRLRRLADNPRHSAQHEHSGPEQAGGRRLNLPMMIAGVVAIYFGGIWARFANESYDQLRADGGMGLALFVGIGALGTVLFGVVLFLRSFLSRPASLIDQATQYQKARTTRSVLSLIGLSSGVATAVSMLFMFTAQRFDTEAAQSVVGTSSLVAILLLSLTTMIALVTRFTPGYGFFRVILSFVAGWVLTLGIIRVLRVDLSSWPWFTALVQ
jgi:hypothetical protein